MYFVVDIEATCCESRGIPDNNEIIEIGIVASSDEGDYLGDYQSFVRPVISPKLSRFCRRLTNIQQSWVDLADPLADVIPRIKEWAKKTAGAGSSLYPWFAFGNWDQMCLTRDCARHNLLPPFGRHADLKKLYAEFGGDPQCGLKEAVLAQGLMWEGSSHRAMDDARNAANLAKVIIPDKTLKKLIGEVPPISSD